MVLCITGSLGGGAIAHGRRNVSDALVLARAMVAEGYREVEVLNLDTREIVFSQETMGHIAAQVQ